MNASASYFRNLGDCRSAALTSVLRFRDSTKITLRGGGGRRRRDECVDEARAEREGRKRWSSERSRRMGGRESDEGQVDSGEESGISKQIVDFGPRAPSPILSPSPADFTPSSSPRAFLLLPPALTNCVHIYLRHPRYAFVTPTCYSSRANLVRAITRRRCRSLLVIALRIIK